MPLEPLDSIPPRAPSDYKYRREPETFGPWPSLPTKFEELLDFTLPSILQDASKTERTADYSAMHLSPLFAEFSYFDDDGGVFSPRSHELWNSMGVHSCLRAPSTVTGYTDERFVSRAAEVFNELAASLFTDILTWPSNKRSATDSIEPSPPKDYTIHSGDPHLKYSQQGDKSSICFERDQYGPRIISGLSVEHKTHKVLMQHLSDLLLDQVFTNVRQTGSRAMISKLFLQMCCLECQLNDVTPVLYELNDVDVFVDEDDSESHTDLQLRVNYGMIFTGNICVVAKRAQGVDEAGHLIQGLALSNAHLITGPEADMPFLAFLVAAHVPHGQDLPHIKRARINYKKEQIRAVAEREAENRKKDEHDDSGEGRSPGGPSAGGGNPGGSSGSGGPVGGNKKAEPERGAVETQVDSRYLRLHFDAPGSSREPHILLKVSERGLRRQLVPSPPIDSAPRLYLTHRLASGHIAQVFCGHLAIVFKVYGEDDLNDLLREMSAYARLSHLTITPKLLGAFSLLQGNAWTGTGLLLENIGVQVGSGDSWKELRLPLTDRRRVYDALTELHTAKVLHTDFVPRNVLRRNDGSFFVIDFGNASVDHLCPGTDCGELKQLRDALEI
ncbi:hypothetical protein B0H13DRAFT_1961681 [Mycena leptocephala]|nr:hypothetical protein B0H13DRAFT_1961681 [Mycena leptocephala]